MKDKRQKVGGIAWPMIPPQLAYLMHPFNYDMWAKTAFAYPSRVVGLQKTAAVVNVTFVGVTARTAKHSESSMSKQCGNLTSSRESQELDNPMLPQRLPTVSFTTQNEMIKNARENCEDVKPITIATALELTNQNETSAD
ncbi:hypothetical protein KIN20_002777 [Parelaphostrongylus tenuis]|uniref:Uncharacterized protein n=1 Tax=Parelaphostrongylus tenuis TaxID=148309 RepID=A0AAD5MP09_PARTN|nr:hypothetical protein KIN20_002777 [Parelaphostrongylus tenuis]